ncbi:MAG: PH domain-containing protein [Sphingomicrobium sp.]
MSEPTSPDRAVGPPEHLHPLFLLSGLSRSLRSLAGAYALIAWLAVSRSVSLAILAALGLLAVGIVGVAIYWRRFEFRVGADEIRIDHGIVSRTHRSIPFDRIQDVDITQGPLQRLLGLAKVTFETGGGSGGKNSEEGALHTIALERADQIRALVRSRRTSDGSAAPASSAEVPDEQPVYAMGIARVLLAGTFNFSLAILAALVGFTQTVGNTVGFDPFSESFWRSVLSAGDPVAQYAERHQLAAVLGGALLLLLLGLVTGIVRTFVREFGFRLDRTDVGLRRRRGLLTRTDVTLPVARAQAVVVGTGPVRDWFGWRELKLQSLARDEDGKGDHVLAPLACDDEVNEIVSQLGWHRLATATPWQRISRVYVTAFAIAVSPLFLAALVQAAFVWRLAIGYAIALVLVIGMRWLAWRRTAYALDGERLLVKRGWWRRTLTILPIAKIQSIDLSENFITRWFGTARLTFGVAGGGLRGHSIPAIPRGAARQLRDELLGFAA